LTKREAAKKWVGECNAIPRGMIEALWMHAGKYEGAGWREVTTPRIGEKVYHHAFEQTGEILSVEWKVENSHTADYYSIRLDNGAFAIAKKEAFSTDNPQTALPTWDTMWSFGEPLDDFWLEQDGGLQAMSDCGFRIYEHVEFGYFFGIDVIDGEGYDFYENHWIPAYEACGLHWHDEEAEQMGEPKQIRFIDPQYNELFRIPDGGSIVVTRPEGEMYPGVQEQWIAICKYLDDTHVSINGECYHIRQFAEIQQNIGSTYFPEPNPEMVSGYRVTHRTFVRDLVFKLGHNPDAVQPYATWRCNKADPSNNYWGHYWSDRSTAHTDFFRRADAARTDTPYDHTTLMEHKPSLRDTLRQNAERSKAEFDDHPLPKESTELEV